MAIKKTRGYGRLILFLAIVSLFIYTNPDEKMHLDFVKEIIHREDKKHPSFYSGLERIIEVALGDERYNSLLKDYYKRKDFILFSVTEKKVEEEWQILTIGVLGNIIAWDDIENGLDRIMNKLDL